MKKSSILFFIGLILIIAGIAFLFIKKPASTPASNNTAVTTKSNPTPVAVKPNLNIDPNTLAGIQTGNAPWQPEIANLQTRLKQIGLPALAQEGTILHTHQHLDIFINGNQSLLPANIGIDDAKGFISPIHTHDETGMTHVESPVDQKFYLGQFFDIWGVRFTATCMGGYCNTKDQTLRIFVNGTMFTGDPRTIEMLAHEEIAITYGTILQSPFPAPSSFDFPAGY